MSACVDHLGNVFDSLTEMCEFYGISLNTYYSRINLYGYTLEETLTTPINKGKPCTDHKGNKFPNIAAMCKYWGIDYSLYNRRASYGWSIERILEKPKQQHIRYCIDHMGNEFKDEKAMCKHWGIGQATYFYRINNGWSQKDALETKPEKKGPNVDKCYDHLGNEFKSSKVMAEYWGVNYITFRRRIRDGWDLKDALETHDLITWRCKDHLGNEFDN